MAKADDDYQEENHPALKGFSRPVEYVKHTAKSALGGAVKGGLIGGVATVGLAMIVGGAALAWIPLIGPILGAMGSGALATYLGGMTAGAILGAKIGGGIGAATGLLNAGEAADEAAEKRIVAYERREARQQRVAALEQQRDMQRAAMAQQAQAMGLTPNVGFNRGPEERTL